MYTWTIENAFALLLAYTTHLRLIASHFWTPKQVPFPGGSRIESWVYKSPDSSSAQSLLVSRIFRQLRRREAPLFFCEHGTPYPNPSLSSSCWRYSKLHRPPVSGLDGHRYKYTLSCLSYTDFFTALLHKCVDQKVAKGGR